MLHPFAYAIDRWLPRQPRGLDKRHRTSRQANTRSAIDRHATVKTRESRATGLIGKGNSFGDKRGNRCTQPFKPSRVRGHEKACTACPASLAGMQCGCAWSRGKLRR